MQSFLQVLDAGGVAKAAEIAGVVQPALSRQIKALEEELDVQLLTRHAWGVTPTQAGLALAASARQIVKSIEELRHQLHTLEHDVSGIVTVAASSTFAPILFPILFETVSKEYPNILLRFSDKHTHAITTDLMAGRIDLALMHQSRPLPGFRFNRLFRERLGIFGTPARIAEIDRLHLRDYPTLPVVLPPLPNETRARIEIALGDKLDVVCEGGGMESTIRMVSSGRVYGFINFAAIAPEVSQGKLAFLPVESELLEREICLATMINRPMTKAVQIVEAELRTLILEHGPRLHWYP